MEEKSIVIQQGGFGFFVRGAVFGVALALLLAPRSGRETREILSEKGNEIKDKTLDMVKETTTRVQESFNDTRVMLEETFKNVKDAAPSETKAELKRELEIMEEMNNPDFPL
jgi:gas vesicle protein